MIVKFLIIFEQGDLHFHFSLHITVKLNLYEMSDSSLSVLKPSCCRTNSNLMLSQLKFSFWAPTHPTYLGEKPHVLYGHVFCKILAFARDRDEGHGHRSQDAHSCWSEVIGTQTHMVQGECVHKRSVNQEFWEK